MKFRPLFILIGFLQAVGLFIVCDLLLYAMGSWIDAWLLAGNNAYVIILFLLTCAALLLPYPVYLFNRKQKTDAVTVFVTSVVCVAAGIVSLMFMASQMVPMD